MESFKNNQRVKIIYSENGLLGKTGVVVRLRYSGPQAWVKMDEPISDNIRYFPADDPYDRGNNVLLWPGDCKEIKEGP